MGDLTGQSTGVLQYSSWLLTLEFSHLEIFKGPGKSKHHEGFRSQAPSVLETEGKEDFAHGSSEALEPSLSLQQHHQPNYTC